MIIDAIFATLFNMISKIISFLPVLDFSDIFSSVSDMASFWDILAKASCFLPVNTVMHILILIIGLYTISVGFAFFNWLIAKIPTIN